MKKLFIFFIKLYKKYISPMKRTKCTYYPSCYSYCIEAIEKYGVLDIHRKSYAPIKNSLQIDCNLSDK